MTRGEGVTLSARLRCHPGDVALYRRPLRRPRGPWRRLATVATDYRGVAEVSDQPRVSSEYQFRANPSGQGQDQADRTSHGARAPATRKRGITRRGVPPTGHSSPGQSRGRADPTSVHGWSDDSTRMPIPGRIQGNATQSSRTSHERRHRSSRMTADAPTRVITADDDPFARRVSRACCRPRG